MDSSEHKELFSCLEEYETYKNNPDKEVICDFLQQLQKDFRLSSCIIENIVRLLFDNPTEKHTTYDEIFRIISSYDLPPLDVLEDILVKYNGVKLNLPLNVNNTHVSYLSVFMYKLLMSKDNNNDKDIQIKINMMRSIVKYLPKNTKYLMDSLDNYNLLDMKYFDIIMDNSLNFATSTKYKSLQHYEQTTVMYTTIFRLLLEHDVYDSTDKSMSKLLTVLYCRGDIMRLSIMKTLKPQLLSIDLVQTKKILFYGRSDILEFVIHNMHDQLSSVIGTNNPYDVENIYVCYYLDTLIDVDKLYEYSCIPEFGIQNFNECFKLIDSLHLPNAVFGVNQINQWISTITNEDEDYRHCFMDVNELTSKLNTYMETKSGIKSLVDTIGYDDAWEIISKKNSSILKILLESTIH